MSASEKPFVVFERGRIRDEVILAKLRDCLRAHVNPTTGATFTEDEIARATQPGSRFWIEAEAIDLLGQSNQARAEWLANQLIPSRASGAFLEGYHGPKWLGNDSKLPATGASGVAVARATPGSIYPGSTTIGDPTAAVATDPNGKQYQVTEDVTVDSSGVANLPMQAIDLGEHTNIPSNTVLTWAANQPGGSEPEASVQSPGFSGGFPEETDREWGLRIEDRIRHRQNCGNPAHFVAWAREASVGVEYAFIYPAALNLGTVMVCIMGKRSAGAAGPLVRLEPGKTVMADATRYLVPPNSPVVPDDVLVVVVGAVSQPSNISLRLSMPAGSAGGWYDTAPWPNPGALTGEYESMVTGVASQTEFTITTVSDLPGGVSSLSGSDAPALMLWDVDTSSFERLLVESVTRSGGTATVTLSAAPTATISVGSRVSPYTEQHSAVSEAVVAHFDALGPGELHDLDTRSAGDRGARFPKPNNQYPYRLGQSIISRLMDAMGNVVVDANLVYASRSAPDIPVEIIDGPNMLTLGALTLLPL